MATVVNEKPRYKRETRKTTCQRLEVTAVPSLRATRKGKRVKGPCPSSRLPHPSATLAAGPCGSAIRLQGCRQACFPRKGRPDGRPSSCSALSPDAGPRRASRAAAVLGAQGDRLRLAQPVGEQRSPPLRGVTWTAHAGDRGAQTGRVGSSGPHASLGPACSAGPPAGEHVHPRSCF